MINKIISAGLVDVEQAVLDVAIKVDIPHGGWIPHGHKTEDSSLLEKYTLKEIPASSELEHTEKNILDSEGTLVISRGDLSGEATLLQNMAEKRNRPFLHMDLDTSSDFFVSQTISAWIAENKIKILHVTGPDVSKDSALYSATAKIFETVLYLDMMGVSLYTIDQMSKSMPPQTVDDATDLIISKLTLKDKTMMANMNQEDLFSLLPSLGEFIKENFGSEGENEKLIESCLSDSGKNVLQEDDAVLIVIEKVWERLRKTHRLRVVK